jgi:hypothetical protein
MTGGVAHLEIPRTTLGGLKPWQPRRLSKPSLAVHAGTGIGGRSSVTGPAAGSGAASVDAVQVAGGHVC